MGGCRSNFARRRPKGGFKAAIETEVVREIEALVGDDAVDGLDFEAIETAARSSGASGGRAGDRAWDRVSRAGRVPCGSSARAESGG